MKQFSRLSLILVVSLSSFVAFAQRGVHGSITVTAANVIVNEYTALSTTALAGSNTITVANSSLNANGRFATALQPGDLLMIYTTQGATLNGMLTGNIAFPLDTSWGRITNYNTCGRYEFVQVRSVTNATTIVLDCNLSNTYTVGGTSRSQVIRVPRYNSLTISTGTVTCDAWNGSVGGILVVEVLNNTVINNANGLNATGRGFRGGDLVGDNVAQYGVNNVGSNDPLFGAAKGEGICGSQFDYDPMGGRYGRGAAGNAGGGGCAHNAGGGGGANGGVIANWKGLGVPDPNGAYTAAWNLEPPINTITTLTTANSSGGGKGGYTFSGSNQNAGVTGPGNGAWAGDSRNSQANGYGGRPLDYSTGRLFLGGGGGAGDQNEGFGGNGGAGGGMVFLICFGSVSGTGSVVSNGNNGNNAQGTPASTSYSGKDGAGGGGAGGTIVINATGTITGISATANGGNGGNQVMTAGPFFFGTINEAEGPGGGGGGGYIAVSSGAIARTTTGGNNGTTTSPALSEFPPNGATRGGLGTNNATITNYNITAANVSICSGQTATLTAAFTGTPPVGGTLIWYDAAVAGNTLGTGTSFTTPALTTTTTYYVGSCPGWFRVPVVVTINAAPVANAGLDQTICAGNPVTLTATGGGTYLWNGGTLVNAAGASQNVSPATTTTYTVVVTGVGGCTATDQIQVIVSPAPIANAGLDQTICSGQSVTLTASGGGTYTWNGGTLVNATGASQTVSPSTTTTYTVTAAIGLCTSTDQITVNVNPAPTANAGLDQTICAGNPVTLTATGGGTYSWNGGTLVNAAGASQNVAPSTTTTYTVVVTAANGCTATDQIQVIVSPAPIAHYKWLHSRQGGQSVTLTASGGGTYTWNGGSLVNAVGASQTVSPTTTTTYTVTAAVGLCTSTDQITVNVNPTPTANAGLDQTICAGNPVTLTATGGGTYTWNGGTLVNAAGASQNVSPATTTTYTVLVTAANGCTATDQILVNVNTLPVANAGVDQTICSSTSVTLTASGGGTYTWNGGTLVNAAGASQTVSPATTTTYTVVVTAANGCTASDQMTVFANTPPVAICSASTNPICSGDTTLLTATACNTCTYLWSPAVNLSSTNTQTTNANPNSTTTYTLTVVDANGCVDTASVLVVVNTTPVALAGADVTICSGDSAQLNASGGGSYSWLPNANITSNTINNPIAFPATTTTYTLTVTAANGCTDTDDLLITVNPTPIANAGADITICSGATAQLNGSGTGTYTWTPAATLSNANIANPVASPSLTTTYVMTVTSAAGCDDVDSVTVLVNPTPLVTAGNDVNICANSSIQLNASGATTYVWTPATGLSDDSIANPVASPLITTTYVVTGTTAAGCSDTDTLIVTVSNQLTVTASNDAWICAGNTAAISVNTIANATYAWLPAVTLNNASISNPVASPVSTTTYTVLVTDQNGCQGLDSVTVNVSGPISLAVSNAVTICIGQNTSISASPSGGIGPYTYAWSNNLTGAGPHTVSPATTTTYTVAVTDSLGCVSATQSITVTVNPPLNLSVLGATIICSGDTATLSVSPTGGDGNYTVNWMPGNFTTNTISVNPATTTTYTVTVTDGCTTPSATANVTVTVNQAPVVTLSADALSGCAPLCVNFTGQSTGNCASVAWDFGDLNSSTQQNPNNCYTQAGSYSVTFTCTDAIGCVGTVTIPNLITVNPVPTAAFTSDAPNNLIVLQTGGTAQVCFTDNSQAATTWNWTFDTGTSTQQSPCFQVNDTGYYCAELIVQSSGGCADTTELCIDVENEAVFSIPNVFTPNADGNNDVFTITATGVKAITCELYDRWGVKIYTWDGVSGGWDGRSTSGQQAVDGVYFYVATITDFNNKIIEKQGFVQLVNNK